MLLIRCVDVAVQWGLWTSRASASSHFFFFDHHATFLHHLSFFYSPPQNPSSTFIFRPVYWFYPILGALNFHWLRFLLFIIFLKHEWLRGVSNRKKKKSPVWWNSELQFISSLYLLKCWIYIWCSLIRVCIKGAATQIKLNFSQQHNFLTARYT